MMAKAQFNPAELLAAGFTGFKTIEELRECALDCVPGRLGDIGVYAVLREDLTFTAFLAASTGGRFKGRDPNVSADLLHAKWIEDAHVLYIGKAGKQGGRETLRSRLKAYLNFGLGKPVGHWGGRYLWNLPSSEKLIVCWRLTPDREPRAVEAEMIQEFVQAYGRLPFANLVD